MRRFWKTCSEQFLSHLDMERVYTLEELNKLFGTWAETIYHHRIHSSLNASPIETWQKKSQNIRYPDDDAITFEFLHEKIRKVRNDGTFSLNGITYEAEPHFQGQSITVRYDPAQLDKIYIYEQGELYQKSYPVNETENCKTHRQTIISKSETVSSGISFTNLLEQEGDLNV
jgi:hypothetical protein